MHLQNTLLAALAGTSGRLFTRSLNSTTTIAPCGQITSLLSEFYSDETNDGQNFVFDSELANQCLLSSTIDITLAVNFIKELKKYVEFDTTLAYVKAPPAGYQYPASDILGGLETLASKAATGGFQSQYILDQTLTALLTTAHEGHLFTKFCTSAANTIIYQRPFNLVSISPDGIELPEYYLLDDVVLGIQNSSNIVLINDQNATEFIETESLLQLSDPDTSFNAMFWSTARAPGSGGVALGSFQFPSVNFYPGAWTNVTFSNGTVTSFKNRAVIPAGKWSTDIIDGESFTDHFCVAAAQPQPTTTSSTSSATSTSISSSVPTSTSTALPNVFPYTNVVRDPNNQVAGYFVNGTGYQDTGVLWVAAFSPSNEEASDGATTFQDTVAKFLIAMGKANKTKLIIDLSGNGGGNTLLPTDLFKRLFPQIEAYGAGSLRVPVAGDIWGQTFAAIPDELIYPTQEEIAAQQIGDKGQLFSNFFQYRSRLTTDLKNFTGWSDLYPPVIDNGDNFTASSRGPLNNTLYTQYIDGLNVFGYAGNPANYTQPFLTKDIIILTDGVCASACSIFTELMTRHANVKTIVVGGRPQNTPMQAIGGTKGSLATHYSDLAQTSQLLMNYSSYIPENLRELANKTFPGLVPLPLGAASDLASYSINGENNIAIGDDTPLQFVFEPANCRIFYTEETVQSPSKLWEQVHDIVWKGGKCAWGSMNATNATNARETGPSTVTTVSGAGGISGLGSGMLMALGAMAFMIL